MSNEPEMHSQESMGHKHPRAERTRMKSGYGRESVDHPEDTGIRRGDPDSKKNQREMGTDGGQPSRQTSTAEDMSGQG